LITLFYDLSQQQNKLPTSNWLFHILQQFSYLFIPRSFSLPHLLCISIDIFFVFFYWTTEWLAFNIHWQHSGTISFLIYLAPFLFRFDFCYPLSLPQIHGSYSVLKIEVMKSLEVDDRTGFWYWNAILD